MEIPTKNVIENLGRLTNNHQHHPLATKAIALDALDTIKAQALEIRELQLVIVRLRDEARAKRRMSDFRSLPEPRPVWEQFKRTWKEIENTP